MPGGDRTGPNGGGPKTGRAMGYCAGNENAGFSTAGGGRGQGRRRRGRGGRGMGGGQGRGNGWGAQAAGYSNQEVADLPMSVEMSPEPEAPVQQVAPLPEQRESELDVLAQQLGALEHQTEKLKSRIQQLRVKE